jgi:hypothetical protein
MAGVFNFGSLMVSIVLVIITTPSTGGESSLERLQVGVNVLGVGP